MINIKGTFEHFLFLNGLELLVTPIYKNHLYDILITRRRGYMKSIAPISVNEAYVNAVDQQQVQDIELTLLGGDQETVDGIVVHRVGISPSFVN